jgi:hypothetical protein
LIIFDAQFFNVCIYKKRLFTFFKIYTTMKKILKISYLAVAFILIGSLSASAQIKPTKKKTEEPTQQEDAKPSTTTTRSSSTKKKKTDDYFDESGGFKHRLWYGGGFDLGLNSAQGYSVFSIGVTPMVGYKIIGGLSAGPRAGINYTNIRATDNRTGNVNSVGLTDYSMGVFARYKAFENFFVHAESEYASQQFAADNGQGGILLGADGKPLTKREGRQNTYAGIGYNSGGIFGYEVMALYNFNPPPNTTTHPIALRVGFTYKF